LIPTLTCALAEVDAKANQISNAPAHTIHLNPRMSNLTYQ